MTELPLILKALQRHKTTVAILLLEFAVTFALLSNATLLVWQRFAAIRTVGGLEEQNLLVATPIPASDDNLSYDFSDKGQVATTAIGALPGIKHVSLMTQTPFSGVDSMLALIAPAAGANIAATEVSAYFADQQMRQTLGLRLVAGRWFASDEIAHPAGMPDAHDLHLIILTQELARKLFPNRNPLGQIAYSRQRPMTVIGVVEHLARPVYLGSERTEDAVIFPVVPPPGILPTYAIRLDNGYPTNRMQGRIAEILAAAYGRSLNWKVTPYSDQRQEYFASDRAALRIMVFLLIALVTVATTAIAGLSYYWVHQRAAHVATRRALGAMRREVMKYFLIENLVLSLAGIALGVLLTLSINTWLVLRFGVMEIPVAPLLFGFIAVSLIGQAAVLYPAWRMGSVAPALASRA